MAGSGSFVSRNGERIFLFFACAFLVYAIFSSLKAGEVPDNQQEMKRQTDEAVRAVDEHYKTMTKPFEDPVKPNRDQVLKGGPHPAADGKGNFSLTNNPNVVPPDPMIPYGPLNTPLVKIGERSDAGAVGLIVNMKFAGDDPASRHVEPDKVTFQIQRAASKEETEPAEEEFADVAKTRATGDDTIFKDDNGGKFLPSNTTYFYRARAVSTYQSATEEQPSQHESNWSNVASHGVRDEVNLAYRGIALGGDRVKIEVTKRVAGKKVNDVWIGSLGQEVGRFYDNRTEDLQPLLTEYLLTDVVNCSLKMEYTDHVSVVEIEFESNERTIESDFNAILERIEIKDRYPGGREKVLVTESDPKGTMDDIVGKAFKRAADEHERVNAERFRSDGVIIKALREMASGFASKKSPLRTPQGRTVTKANCPEHEDTALWAEILEGVAPGNQEWVAYCCPVDGKYYVLNVISNETRFVTGPFTLKSRPTREVDVKEAVEEEIDSAAAGNAVNRAPKPPKFLDKPVEHLVPQSGIRGDLRFVIVTKRDPKTGQAAVMELPLTRASSGE